MAAFAPSAGALITWRAVAGLGAAAVFPTTLSIISNAFPDRAERAKAIGLWGAASGVAVALGPIVGGALVEASAWGAAFGLCAGLAAVTAILAVFLIPNSRDPEVPRLDYPGLGLSIAALGMLVYAIISGPERGWASPASLGDFSAAACLFLAFAIWETHVPQPMLDVRLFTNLRFTAASGAVTLSYFGLFGFVFLISQYFQFVLGWSVLEAGTRQLPVALSIAVTSVLGVTLAVRLGTKLVVATGLLLLCGAFTWVSTVDATTSYPIITAQMIAIGAGIGFTSAPATEAIMGVVPAAKAGIGSAVNDATRELGGTLGVAVIGSVAVSLYRHHLDHNITDPAILGPARASAGAAATLAQQIGDPTLATVAQQGFLNGLTAGCYVAAGICLLGALLAAAFLPAHPTGTATATAADAEQAPDHEWALTPPVAVAPLIPAVAEP
jgi:MFS family permease